MHTLLVLTATLLLLCPSGLALPLLPSSPLLDSSSCHMCIITPLPVLQRSARTTKKVSEKPVLELGLRSTMADMEAGIKPSLVPEVTEEEE